jgi:hypothetical protein
MSGDAPLRFRYLSLEVGDDASLGLARQSRIFACPEPVDFQSLQGITVLFALNPVPSNVAIAVSDHVATILVTIGGRQGVMQLCTGLADRKAAAKIARSVTDFVSSHSQRIGGFG